MRKPTWIPGIKWVWKTSDRIDIWAQDKLGMKSPKQRALELAMDINPPKRIERAIDEALGLKRKTTKRNRTDRRKV